LKKIVKIETATNDFEIENQWSQVIDARVNSLFKLHGIFIESLPTMKVEKDLVGFFSDCILDALLEHLEKTYSEPLSKEIQKHSSRFEKIVVNKKKYILNYRQSENDRTSYAIYLIYKAISEADSKGQILILHFN